MEKKKIQVTDESSPDTKIEYRVWNAFRSKLGAAILNGIESIQVALIEKTNPPLFFKKY